jgi:hypothetical protein
MEKFYCKKDGLFYREDYHLKGNMLYSITLNPTVTSLLTITLKRHG